MTCLSVCSQGGPLAKWPDPVQEGNPGAVRGVGGESSSQVTLSRLEGTP